MQSTFPRQLENEVLDNLAEDDPRAIRSRKDLQRINRIMGSAGIIAHVLSRSDVKPKRIIELGAGDGSLMLRIARRLAPMWPDVHVLLLDRQDLVAPETRRSFEQVGWSVEILCQDVRDWVAAPSGERADIALANLFIHHFDTLQIQQLFAGLSKRTDLFIACEPRRERMPLFASRLVGLIGANDVTRSDAVLSVQAGFRDTELSTLWPPVAPGWHLEERRARLFSHLFVASRRGP